VIRADNAEQFVAAFERIRNLLSSPEVQVLREEATRFIQVEAYIEGQEVAVEAVVDRGHLKVLAIFDKPDPLEGPYFEETIYVRPPGSRPEVQGAVTDALAQAVPALGLFHGPVHAEFRLSRRRERRSPQAERRSALHPKKAVAGRPPGVWVLEIA